MTEREAGATEGIQERYVALGDSYTIGEGVSEEKRWPNVLTRRLRDEGIAIELVANPSVTGWTTAQLIEHELPVLEESDATFVTLLIGVNDWVQGVDRETFTSNLRLILDRVQSTLPEPAKALLVTIPDFSMTPEGAKYSRGRDISAGIADFNGVIHAEAAARGLPVVDIFPLSRALTGAAFVAEDGLHPSSEAYARWADMILPVARRLLADRRSS